MPLNNTDCKTEDKLQTPPKILLDLSLTSLPAGDKF